MANLAESIKNKVPKYSIIITDLGSRAILSKKKYLNAEIRLIIRVPTVTVINIL